MEHPYFDIILSKGKIEMEFISCAPPQNSLQRLRAKGSLFFKGDDDD